MDDALPYERERRLLGMLAAGRQWDPESFGLPSTMRRFDRYDIAAAVGLVTDLDPQMERLQKALLLYRWAGDESQHRLIVSILSGRLCHWAHRDGWKIRSPNWAERLATMVLRELQGREVCQECSATGRIWVPGSYEVRANMDGTTRRDWVPGKSSVCACCMGLGVYPWSLREKALFMGIHHSTWIKFWESRYHRLMDFVDGVERKGLRRFGSCLR